jgi:hypothetical protein
VKRTGTFGLIAAGIVVVAGALFMLVFPGPEAATAIAISAVLALLVQLAAFTILRRMRGQGILIGWGLGSLLRLGTLAVYGFVAVRALGLPTVPALLSLATFLFATMILEPLLLEP